MRSHFRNPLLPIAIAAVTLAGGACTNHVPGNRNLVIGLGPVLPKHDPVADIVFGPDRSLCAHSGPVDAAIVAQLNASPLGVAYCSVHPERSILLACDQKAAWCGDPRLSFGQLFQEAALLAGQAHSIDDLFSGWYKRSGEDDMDPVFSTDLPEYSLADASAHLQLLAIANRMDLAQYQSQSKVWTGGAEVHFIYGVAPATGLPAKDLTINLEFVLPDPASLKTSYPALAAEWRDLPVTTDSKYADALVKVLQDSGLSLGKSLQTAATLLRSRVNHIQNGPWRVSQLLLSPGGMFTPANLDFQAQVTLSDAQFKKLWVELKPQPQGLGAGSVAYSFSSYPAGYSTLYQSGNVLNIQSGVCDDQAKRNLFAMQQCTWCHTTETKTDFAHVHNRTASDPALLSNFLVGAKTDGTTIHPDLKDLYYGESASVFTFSFTYKSNQGPPKCVTPLSPPITHQFHDVARRTLFLASFLGNGGPFRKFGGNPAALNFATGLPE